MNEAGTPVVGLSCEKCGSEIAPGLLACAVCQRLIHTDTLKALAAQAESAQHAGDIETALAAWQRTLTLLPTDSRQHAAVQSKLHVLGEERRARGAGLSAPHPSSSGRGRQSSWVAGATAIGLFLLTKGKLLLLGLSKSSTVFSMLAAMGVYWVAWGLWFAAGFVLSIYVHEMGHVAALHRYGIPASAPMFIPGVGAFIRSSRMPSSLHEQAQIGLGGPVWGLGAAVASYGAFLATGNPFWAALAHVGAIINLFNLIPVWQLDGSRAFAAFTRGQRWIAALAIGAAWAVTQEGMLLLLLIVAGARAMMGSAPEQPDGRSLALYVFLIAALSGLSLVGVSIPPGS